MLQKYGGGFAVVTGGTDGIGLQIVKKLLLQGFDVFVIGLKTDKITKADLPQTSILYKCDLGDTASVDYICEWIEINQPTLLFNVAGFCKVEHFDTISNPGEYINSHINSLVRITSSFLRVRKENGGIIFFSSQVSFFVSPFGVLYASTKAFIAQFANSLAAEYPKIDILCLRPGGVVRTSFFNNSPNYWYFDFVKLIGQNPETITSLVFKALGRVTMLDVGMLTILSRIFLIFFDENVLKWIGWLAAIPLGKILEKR